MTSRHTPRRYRKSSDRRVWVFSDLNHDLAADQIAKILTAAGLAQARREADAQAADTTPDHRVAPEREHEHAGEGEDV